MEGGFFQGLRSSLQHSVKRFQDVEHAGDVPLAEVEPGGFFQSFVPELVPQNGHSDQLLANLLNIRPELLPPKMGFFRNRLPVDDSSAFIELESVPTSQADSIPIPCRTPHQIESIHRFGDTGEDVSGADRS